jgi:hypothetical protein
MLTTSLDRRWNDLPVAGWSYLALMDQMLQYLTHREASVFNFLAGDSVSLSVDPPEGLPAYLLRKPGLQQLRNEIPQGASSLLIPDVDQIGNYRITGVDEKKRFECGFSVNAPGEESNLKRLAKDELDARLGEERYSLARDIEHLQRNVRAGRLGREAMPLIALLLLAIFVGEHMIANRFYGTDSQSKPPEA